MSWLQYENANIRLQSIDIFRNAIEIAQTIIAENQGLTNFNKVE